MKKTGQKNESVNPYINKFLRLIFLPLLLAFSLVVAICVWVMLSLFMYQPIFAWKTHHAIRSIPGVKVIEPIKWDDDGFGFMLVEVEGKGTLLITNFHPEEFKSASYISLRSIGGCTLRNDKINVGTLANNNTRLSFPNLTEVINHYDQILDRVKSMPNVVCNQPVLEEWKNAYE